MISVILFGTLVVFAEANVTTNESVILQTLPYNVNEYISEIQNYVYSMSEYDSSYNIMSGITYEYVSELYDDDLNISSLLFKAIKNDQYIGYIIIRTSDKVVLESSLSTIPYNVDHIQQSNAKMIYDYGTYAISVSNQSPIYLYSSNENETLLDEYFTESVTTKVNSSRTTLPNIAIYKQKNDNCIVTAISHLLLYWNNNGCSLLTPTISSQSEFDSLKDTIDSYFTSGYANNSIPKVLLSYALSRSAQVSSADYTILPSNKWNPTYDDVKAQISQGKPLLLDFAKGSDYSASVGHMTMCVGAASKVVENDYVLVVDGHSSAVVTKIWDDTINDFICSVTVSKTIN